jgi:hypothetical protein
LGAIRVSTLAAAALTWIETMAPLEKWWFPAKLSLSNQSKERSKMSQMGMAPPIFQVIQVQQCSRALGATWPTLPSQEAFGSTSLNLRHPIPAGSLLRNPKNSQQPTPQTPSFRSGSIDLSDSNKILGEIAMAYHSTQYIHVHVFKHSNIYGIWSI